MTKDELIKQLTDHEDFISLNGEIKKDRLADKLYKHTIHFYYRKGEISNGAMLQILEHNKEAYWLGASPEQIFGQEDLNKKLKQAVLNEIKDPCLFSITSSENIIGVTIYHQTDNKVKPIDYLATFRNNKLEILEIEK